MKIINKSFYSLGSHKYNRLDYKYWHTREVVSFLDYVPLKDLFYVVNGSVQTSNYTDEVTSIPYIRISDIDYKYGISQSNLIFLDEDSVIPEEKILKEDDLILATIGATVGKVGRVVNVVGGTHSNNTVLLRAKQSNLNIKFYEKLFQTDFFINYIFGLVAQKAQPNLQPYEIENIMLPIVHADKVDKCVSEFIEVESQIEALRKQILSTQELIDDILCREFTIDFEKLKEIDKNKRISVAFKSLKTRNQSIRFSCRWSKAVTIQNELIKSVACCCKLGDYIIDTQNGWSPLCSDDEYEYQVLGIDAINVDAKISFSNPKFSSERKNNIFDYKIQDGDFFVSRGNTVDLVSMASVARGLDDLPLTIYPDLMIRVKFSDEVNPIYMAYIFNSFIGRLYFKYAAKGKNQTMVKVSYQELSQFVVPLPDIVEQQRIVNEIQFKIEKQESIKMQITELRKKIDNIIENAIR